MHKVVYTDDSAVEVHEAVDIGGLGEFKAGDVQPAASSLLLAGRASRASAPGHHPRPPRKHPPQARVRRPSPAHGREQSPKLLHKSLVVQAKD